MWIVWGEDKGRVPVKSVSFAFLVLRHLGRLRPDIHALAGAEIATATAKTMANRTRGKRLIIVLEYPRQAAGRRIAPFT